MYSFKRRLHEYSTEELEDEVKRRKRAETENNRALDIVNNPMNSVQASEIVENLGGGKTITFEINGGA